MERKNVCACQLERMRDRMCWCAFAGTLVCLCECTERESERERGRKPPAQNDDEDVIIQMSVIAILPLNQLSNQKLISLIGQTCKKKIA